MLRQRCPVVHSDDFDGYWMLSRYRDVAAAALDPARFVSGTPFIENVATRSLEAIPISLNPPEHTTYRRILNPFFRPSRIAAFEPTVRMLARRHLEPLLDQGGGDFVSSVSHPLPAIVLCRFLGLPDETWQVLKAFSTSSDDSRGSSVAGEEHNRRLVGFISGVIDRRRRGGAGQELEHDLLGAVLSARIDGAPIPDTTATLIVKQLFTAGHGTTSRAIANAVEHLANNVSLQSQLREDPKGIVPAIEEILRLRPPLHQLTRNLTSAVTIGGVSLSAGERVVLNYASANRDTAEFDSPDEFVANRWPNRHLTFGLGIHTCLGAPLARLEVRVVLEELLGAASEISPAGAPVPEEIRAGHFTSGLAALPLRLRVGSRSPG